MEMSLGRPKVLLGWADFGLCFGSRLRGFVLRSKNLNQNQAWLKV